MLVYLVQHGRAKPKEEDPERPLTDEGRREVEAVMLLMMRFGAITAPRIVHSGRLRARETAEIIAAKLATDVEESDGLAPSDDPAKWARRLSESSSDLVIVGHLPHLAGLAALLLCGDPEAGTVTFANGGIVCIGRDDDRWSLKWAIPPGLVQE